MRNELWRLAKDSHRFLKGLQALGVTDLPVAKNPKGSGESAVPGASTGKRGSTGPGGSAKSGGSLGPEGFGQADSDFSSRAKAERLEPFRRQAMVCQACRLFKTRTTVVFGEGSLDSRLVFVGEGPGREEDLQGRPFVGAAGELLTQTISSMGLKRQEVYITNVVKCRPPMNRPPEPDEVAACFGYLKAQLQTVQPKVICALGKTAATTLLERDASMSQLRGQTFQWGDVPVVVTFHPAYLLRNPSAKPLFLQDLKRVKALLKR